MKCTWKECESNEAKALEAKDGKVWARLCKEHEKLLDAAISTGDARKILSYYVKAKGGAAAAAKSMME